MSHIYPICRPKIFSDFTWDFFCRRHRRENTSWGDTPTHTHSHTEIEQLSLYKSLCCFSFLCYMVKIILVFHMINILNIYAIGFDGKRGLYKQVLLFSSTTQSHWNFAFFINISVPWNIKTCELYMQYPFNVIKSIKCFNSSKIFHLQLNGHFWSSHNKQILISVLKASFINRFSLFRHLHSGSKLHVYRSYGLISRELLKKRGCRVCVCVCVWRLREQTGRLDWCLISRLMVDSHSYRLWVTSENHATVVAETRLYTRVHFS